MSEPAPPQPPPAPADAPLPPRITLPRRHLPVVWIVPAIAVLIALWLVAQAQLMRGPELTIRFRTAEGVEPGKTRVRFKEVDIGEVERVTLSEDRSQVIVHARLAPEVKAMLVKDTRFWVVRPRVTAGGISGLGTLLSGAYIGVEAGVAEESARDFVGLEVPPVVTAGLPGRQFVLRSADVGSLTVGAPVFYRRLPVGQVIAYALDRDGGGVNVRVFIDAPYETFVKSNTRFWHASGIDVALDSGGLRVHTEALTALVEGGLAFQTPSDGDGRPQAPENTVFTLFADREAAFRVPDAEVRTFTMYFTDSLRGLVVGAPVDLHGIAIGEVTTLEAEYDGQGRYRFPVTVNIYPDRLRRRYRPGTPQPARGDAANRQLVESLVANGMRAQLRSGNLLTGQLYVSLDFQREAAAAKVDWTANPPVFPTVAGGLEELQASVASVLRKLDRIPVEALVADARGNLAALERTLTDADALLIRLDHELTPAAADTLHAARAALGSAQRQLAAEPALGEQLSDTLRELRRMSRAVRELADTLERNPESILRGKPAERP